MKFLLWEDTQKRIYLDLKHDPILLLNYKHLKGSREIPIVVNTFHDLLCEVKAQFHEELFCMAQFHRNTRSFSDFSRYIHKHVSYLLSEDNYKVLEQRLIFICDCIVEKRRKKYAL